MRSHRKRSGAGLNKPSDRTVAFSAFFLLLLSFSAHATPSTPNPCALALAPDLYTSATDFVNPLPASVRPAAPSVRLDPDKTVTFVTPVTRQKVRGQPIPQIYRPLATRIETLPVSILRVDQALLTEDNAVYFSIDIAQLQDGLMYSNDSVRETGVQYSYSNHGVANMIDLARRFPDWAARYGFEFDNNRLHFWGPRGLNNLLEKNKHDDQRRGLRYYPRHSLLRFLQSAVYPTVHEQGTTEAQKLFAQGYLEAPVYDAHFLSLYLGPETVTNLILPEAVTGAYIDRLNFYRQLSVMPELQNLSSKKRDILANSILGLNTSKNPWVDLSHDFARHFDLAVYWASENNHAKAILELRRLLGIFYFFAGQAQDSSLDSKFWIANRWHNSTEHLKESLKRHEIMSPAVEASLQALADEHFTRLSPDEIHHQFRSSMYDFVEVLSALDDIEQAIQQGPLKW